MSKSSKYPQSIAAPFPKVPDIPRDDDGTLSPEQYIYRQQSPLKGRGAVTNLRGRYDTVIREEFDDGWETTTSYAVEGKSAFSVKFSSDDVESTLPLKTTVTEENAKSIISRNKSPDLPFSLSLNPYRGCEHEI